MRFIKMLGFAMVMAIAAMAFIGAGSASATLCLVNKTPCPAGSQYPVPSTILISSGAVKITGSVTVLCASHITLVHEKTDTGKKLLGSFKLLDWTNCTGCTKVTTTALGTWDDQPIGETGNGQLLPLNVTILMQECPFGLDCTMKSTNGTTELTLDGGTINGSAQGLANTTLTSSGGLCGTTAKLVTELPYVVLSVNSFTSESIFQT
jgi:hypothetical protein